MEGYESQLERQWDIFNPSLSPVRVLLKLHQHNLFLSSSVLCFVRSGEWQFSQTLFCCFYMWVSIFQPYFIYEGLSVLYGLSIAQTPAKLIWHPLLIQSAPLSFCDTFAFDHRVFFIDSLLHMHRLETEAAIDKHHLIILAKNNLQLITESWNGAEILLIGRTGRFGTCWMEF